MSSLFDFGSVCSGAVIGTVGVIVSCTVTGAVAMTVAGSVAGAEASSVEGEVAGAPVCMMAGVVVAVVDAGEGGRDALGEGYLECLDVPGRGIFVAGRFLFFFIELTFDCIDV